MRRILLALAATAITTSAINQVQAQSSDLVFVAVQPCRLADTRKSITGFPLSTGQPQNFLVSGTAEQLFDQRGNVTGGEAGCPNPRSGQTPAAIAAYIVAVAEDDGSSRDGVLFAYPSTNSGNIPATGTGTTINFTKDQDVGNSTNITLCTPDDCPADGEFSILARNTSEHVVVDVLGYYYPARGGIAFTTNEGNPNGGVVPISFGASVPTTVARLKVKAPGAGFISVSATAWADFSHAVGQDQKLDCAIKLPSEANRAVGDPINRVRSSLQVIQAPKNADSGTWNSSISSQGIHAVTEAGTVEFLFVCTRSTTPTNVRDVTFIAQFHASNLTEE